MFHLNPVSIPGFDPVLITGFHPNQCTIYSRSVPTEIPINFLIPISYSNLSILNTNASSRISVPMTSSITNQLDPTQIYHFNSYSIHSFILGQILRPIAWFSSSAHSSCHLLHSRYHSSSYLNS